MHTQLRDPLPPQLNALTTSCKYEPDERSDPLNAETSGRSHLSDATTHRPRQKKNIFIFILLVFIGVLWGFRKF